MRIVQRFTAAIFVTVLISGIAGLEAAAGEKKLDRTFSVSPGGTLTVGTDVGSVEIVGGSGNSVVVSVVVKGSEGDLNDFEISATEVPGGVEVKGERTKSRSRGSWNIDAMFSIKVPKEYGAKIHTSGGDISVTGLKGTVGGSTSGGDIRLDGIEGPVDMKTSGGDVRAKTVVGDLRVKTSGGSVTVESVKGSVDAVTSGGNVSVSGVTGKVDAKTSGGNVHVSVVSGNDGISAKTSGGNVEIMIPPDVGANIEASTSGGSVECDLPLTVSGKIHESRVTGTVNGGGNPIVAKTSGGNIHIRSSK